ncbi:unnamed protein product, partial [Mesocestoides corti]
LSKRITFINEKINSKKVVIFSKSYCPYCHKVFNIFAQYLGKDLPENEYEVVELTTLPNADAIQDELQKMTGARTVPRVFINGKCIGGADDTVSALKSGLLYTLLTS